MKRCKASDVLLVVAIALSAADALAEDSFHRLIESATQAGKTDREIYAFVQSRQKSIEPIFSQVRYALPALARQKGEMARETVALLGARRPIDGYMEIGTTGRYVSRLRSSLTFAGDTVLRDRSRIAPASTRAVVDAHLRIVCDCGRDPSPICRGLAKA